MKMLQATSPNFRGHMSGKWSLCLGAGVSRGIVPTWQELTRRLVNETFATAHSEAVFSTLVSESGWGLDSWIQACANKFLLSGKTNDDFYDLIEKHLYSDLRAKAQVAGIEKVLVTVLDRPRNASRDEVKNACEFFEREFPGSTLLALTRFLLRALQQDRLPEAIISFNADTLMHTLLELYQRRDHYNGPPPHSHPKYAFRTILRPLASASGELTPIYHCHGAIKPRSSTSARRPKDSRDRLIFLESEYIRVATENSSWAETLFMFHAQTTRMIFCGFSMSDPNMRRWMALSHQSALHDVTAMSSSTKMSPRHIWITTEPTDSSLKELRNDALLHLGIRPGWIADWSQIEPALSNLIAL
jgi:hypothetical protein